jgi:hypothetical protein
MAWFFVKQRVQLYTLLHLYDQPILTKLGPSPTDSMWLRFDQEKNHFTIAYWSNLQSVTANLPPARPQRDDCAPLQTEGSTSRRLWSDFCFWSNRSHVASVGEGSKSLSWCKGEDLDCTNLRTDIKFIQQFIMQGHCNMMLKRIQWFRRWNEDWQTNEWMWLYCALQVLTTEQKKHCAESNTIPAIINYFYHLI